METNGVKLMKAHRRGALVLATVLVAPTAGADVVKYFHTDGLGSTRVVTNESGGVVERHDYLPFGEECTTGACATNPRAGGGQPKKFTGKERDGETGMDYFGARYHRAPLGRFTSVDPVVTWGDNLFDPQRWNRYAYVRNSPLRYVDPDGRKLVPQGKPGSGFATDLTNAIVASSYTTNILRDLDDRTDVVITVVETDGLTE